MKQQKQDIYIIPKNRWQDVNKNTTNKRSYTLASLNFSKVFLKSPDLLPGFFKQKLVLT